MSGSSSNRYNFEPSAPFVRSARALKKACKGKLKQIMWENLLTDVLDAVMAAPRQIQGHPTPEVQRFLPEPWPSKYDPQECEFWKAYFLLPWESGGRRLGRLMYMIHEPSQTVIGLLLYTHADFEGRPDDRYLKGVFREAEVPR